MCGTKIERKLTCKSCGADLIPGFRFCELCGTPVGDAPAPVQKSAPAQVKKQVPASNIAADTAISAPSGEPFFKKWIAEHKGYAERENITWISEFKGDFAVARINGSYKLVKKNDYSLEVCADNVCLDFKETASRYISDVKFSDDKASDSLDYWCCIFGFSEEITQDTKNAAFTAFTGKDYPQDMHLPYIGVIISYDGRILRTTVLDGWRIWIYPLGKNFYAEVLVDELNKYKKECGNVYNYSARANWQYRLVATRSGDVICDRYSDKLRPYYSKDFVYIPSAVIEYTGNNIREEVEKSGDKGSILNLNTGKLYRLDNTTRCFIGGRDGRYILRYSNCVGNSGVPEIIDNKDNVLVKYDESYFMPSCYSYSEGVIDGGRGIILRHKDYLAVGFSKAESIDGRNSHTTQDIYIYREDTNELSLVSNKRYIIFESADYEESFVNEGCDFADLDNNDRKDLLFTYKNKLFLWFGGYEYIGKDNYGDAIYKGYTWLLDEKMNEIKRLDYDVYGDRPKLYNINDTLYLKLVQKDMLGTENDVLLNLNTGEQLVCVPKGQLVEEYCRHYYGKYSELLTYVYKIGQLRAFGNPYFLISEHEEGCGLIDMKGNYIIPKSSNNIAIYAGKDIGLINKFVVEECDFKFKVYDVNGRVIIEGDVPVSNNEEVKALCSATSE